MTGAEVAAMFRTTESTVRYWKHVGKIKAIRVGRRSLFAVEDVEALIAAARASAA